MSSPQRSLQSLLDLTPCVQDLARSKLPEEPVILQVIDEKRVEGDGMRLALSDGHHYFKWIVAKGELPGKYSFVRIYPSEENKVFAVMVKSGQVKRCIKLGSWTKILDGQVSNFNEYE